MSALLTSLAVFVVVLLGAFAGAYIGKVLPEHHLSTESKDMVKIGAGFISTLAALVLGLLVASAKTAFDTKSDEVQAAAAKIILLDRNLREYGPSAQPARDLMRTLLITRHGIAWIKDEVVAARGATAATSPMTGIERVRQLVDSLRQDTDEHKSLRTRSLTLVDDLAQMRWLMVEQSTTSVSMPMLIVLMIWLATISGCLALYAPRNGTIVVVTVLCALSVSASIFLILEMYDPFSGLLRISDAPIVTAIGYLSQ